MLRIMERPLKATLRPAATAASTAACTRYTLEAKQARMTRCFASATMRLRVGAMADSEPEIPGVVALVESHRNRSIPSSPRRDRAGRSVGRPSGGVWSSLMSPVMTTRPALVLMAMPRQSGIEWLTAQKRRLNGPRFSTEVLPTSMSLGRWWCSRHLAAIRARVNLEAMIGRSGRSFSSQGMAPIWSSCP